MESTSTDALELSVARYIDAPPARVWQIMTERLTEWWCPKPWMVEVIEQDWRPGGRSAMIMLGPNGEEMPHEGIFLEVTPGRRFVTTDALDSRWRPRGPFMVGIWEDCAGGRRHALYRLGPPLDGRGDEAARRDGLHQGLGHLC